VHSAGRQPSRGSIAAVFGARIKCHSGSRAALWTALTTAVMKNIFVLFLIVAITVLGQGPYTNFADAQQTEPGREAELIVLVSHLVALGIDCSFQINQNELQKLVAVKGFKIEDFLPNGKFSARVEEQINNARDLIKNKGCRVARDIILSDFPGMGR
jgi:hypothetical protein